MGFFDKIKKIGIFNGFSQLDDDFYDELEESLANSDMLRISKSVMLNLSKIKSLSPALNGRFEAILDNGERVIISRQYVAGLKKRLGI